MTRWKSLPKRFQKPATVRRKAVYQETPLHISIVSKLRRDFAPHDLVFAHPFNGGKRGKKDAALAKALGQRAGIPDLLFWWPERIDGTLTGRMDCGMIEIKTRLGTLSDEQKAVRNLIQAFGGKWALCRDYESVKATLEGWGVRTHA